MIVAGVPVVCLVANQAYQLSTTNLLVKTLHIQPLYTNGGVLYVGDSTLNPLTPAGVFAVLQVPSPTNVSVYEEEEHASQNGLNVKTFWVSSTQAGDTALWSYDQQ